MPELDVSHFKASPSELEDLNAGSVEAPERPAALDTSSDQEDIPLTGEVLPATLPDPSRIPPRLTPVQRIIFSQIESRRDLMRELNQTLPLNEYNLPRFYYRADLLDYHQLAEANGDAEKLLDVAIVHLEYSHGYPTNRDGQPFWSQLSYETAEAYGAFADYLALPGVRAFSDLKAYPEGALSEWFHTYAWHFRAKAYDMFRATHHTRMRVNRIMTTEDDHFLESQKMFRVLAREFNNKSAEDYAEMSPGDIISALEKVAKLQRVSAGLPATGAPEPSKTQQPVSLEVQMRQIAKQEGIDHGEEEEIDTLELLQSPEALETAQELIIKVNRR
jgi:hypothetical protein